MIQFAFNVDTEKEYGNDIIISFISKSGKFVSFNRTNVNIKDKCYDIDISAEYETIYTADININTEIIKSRIKSNCRNYFDLRNESIISYDELEEISDVIARLNMVYYPYVSDSVNDLLFKQYFNEITKGFHKSIRKYFFIDIDSYTFRRNSVGSYLIYFNCKGKSVFRIIEKVKENNSFVILSSLSNDTDMYKKEIMIKNPSSKELIKTNIIDEINNIYYIRDIKNNDIVNIGVQSFIDIIMLNYGTKRRY